MSARFGGGYEGIPIPRGLMEERDLFDSVRDEARIPFTDFERQVREGYGHMPYENAITVVRNAQPVHRSKPAKPFARALQHGLIKELYGDYRFALDPKVGFYTGVGSALDIYHGTDAFFEFNKDSGLQLPTEGRVTLGVTTKEKKEDDKLKTNIEIWLPERGLDLDNEPELFYYAVSEIVQQILRLRKDSPNYVVKIHDLL